jgi:hypothetical protein
MGLSNLLSNSQQTVCLLQGNNVIVQFDASLREQHGRESPMTEFEIENGQVISDHQIVRPFKLQLQVIVTDFPINLIAGLVTAGILDVLPNPAVLGAAAGALAVAPALLADSPGGPVPDNRQSNVVYNQLLGLQETRLPFNVFTSLKLYKNMWIKNVGAPRTPNTGRQIIIDLDLVQALIVASQTTSLTSLASAAISAAVSNQGAQQGTPYAQTGYAQGSTGSAPNFPGH